MHEVLRVFDFGDEAINELKLFESQKLSDVLKVFDEISQKLKKEIKIAERSR